jgi:hypothetical protein
MKKTRRYFEQERTEETETFFFPSVISVCSCSILFFLLSCSSVFAHEVRPAYLELRQTGPETYDALWKVPGLGENLRLGLYVELPAGCTNVTQPRGSMANNAFTERWTVKCAGGLTGGTIHIAGLSATMTDVLVRLEREDGSAQVVRLTASSPSFVVEAAPSRMQVAATYLSLGVEHILFGIDHLLFVLALLIITSGSPLTPSLSPYHGERVSEGRVRGTTWRLVKTVTAFTAAHSLTLAAATLGFVHVPQRPVEAAIALSIMFVAAEIVRLRTPSPPSGGEGASEGVTGPHPVPLPSGERELIKATPSSLRERAGVRVGLTVRAPWIVAFVFGLLHGFGFAGALTQVGLPQQAIPLALLFFNVGVELGQLLFIATVLAMVALGRRVTLQQPAWMWRLAPYGIGSLAAYWTIERVVGFWR